MPRGKVRPTQDRVREALFSMLGARLVDARFLDLYAGSGSVGLGAASRGAAFVCWVERSRRVLPVLKANVDRVDVPGRVVGASVATFLRGGHNEDPYDIVFADPPYDLSEDDADRMIRAVGTSGVMAGDGIFVFEQAASSTASDRPGWRTVAQRIYGQTRLVFYAKVT